MLVSVSLDSHVGFFDALLRFKSFFVLVVLIELFTYSLRCTVVDFLVEIPILFVNVFEFGLFIDIKHNHRGVVVSLAWSESA